MISSRWTRSRRFVFTACALAATVAAALALTMTRASQAEDPYASLGESYSLLESGEAPGVYVVSPTGDSELERDKIRKATPVNPVLFSDGPVDTSRIRRADAQRASLGVAGGSKVRGVWVAPSKFGGMCVVVTVGNTEGAGGSCAHSGSSAEPATMLIFGNGTNGIAAGETVIAGAVPDDVTAVRVALANGTSTTIPIVENAFSFDTMIAITSYSYISAEGATEPTTVENPNA